MTDERRLVPDSHHVIRFIPPIQWKAKEDRPNRAAFKNFPLSVFVEEWLGVPVEKLTSGRGLAVVQVKLIHAISSPHFEVVADGVATGQLAHFGAAHASIEGPNSEAAARQIRDCFCTYGRVSPPADA